MLVPFLVITDSCYSSYTKSKEICPNLSVGEIKCDIIHIPLHLRKKKIGKKCKKTPNPNKKPGEKNPQKIPSEYYPSSLKP